MASRRSIPPAYERRPVQASVVTRRGHSEQLPLPELLENKLAQQAADIDRFTGDNRKLAATHVALRQDLVATQQEIQKLKDHIRSIRAESDIQIRVLLPEISRMESDIRAGENIKKDLEKAHMEARSLVAARHDLTSQIQQASQELEKAQADVKRIPEMLAELDSLRQEHQKLRKTFEYEKGLNIEKVEQMKIMERNLVGMAKEVERLRAEMVNAERKAQAPTLHSAPYANPDPLFPPPAHTTTSHLDQYGRAYFNLAGGIAGEGRAQYENRIEGRVQYENSIAAPVVPGSHSHWRPYSNF